MKNETDLIVPVYLNQRVVFDLVAMLQDGIATVTKVVETEGESSSAAAEVGGTFGLNKALSSLLKVNLSGSLSGETGGESSASRSEERVHTPASLFYKVRQLLVQKSALEKDSEKYKPQPGDFVEFHSSLNKNPIIETMDGLLGIIDIASTFSQSTSKPSKGGKRAPDQFQVVRQQIATLTETLKSGGTLDLITPPLLSSYRCVVTLESQYLNDPSMSDLVEGTLQVIGKVIRVVGKDQGSVSLMRKTALGQMPKATLEGAFSQLEGLSETEGFRFPALTWEISGPVIQLLPVAIFA